MLEPARLPVIISTLITLPTGAKVELPPAKIKLSLLPERPMGLYYHGQNVQYN